MPAKRGTDSFSVRGVLNFSGGYWKSCCNYPGYSDLLAFLCGSQVHPLEIKNIPPILAGKILPPPGQQERLFSLPFSFHIFPFQRGKPDIFYGINLKGLSSLGKREDGRDFWKGLFSRLNSYETEEKNQKKPGENQKFSAPEEYR